MDIGKYKLSILPLFEEDLNEIVDYVALQLENPIAAQALADDVERALIERTACAESFEPYHSKFQRELPYYRIYVRNYVIYYVVKGDTMEVRRILYKGRDRENII